MSDFEFLPGKNNILLIAPHGRPEDDINTGELTRKLAVKLECYAAINEKYRKPDEESEEVTNADLQIADLNNKKSINNAGLTADWLDEIKKRKKTILDNIQDKGNVDTCYIFLIHGAKDKNVKAVCQEADVLIGIGRSKDKSGVKKDRPTATEDNLKNFIQALKDEGSIKAVEAKAAQKDTDDKENWYAGHAKNNLNQCLHERIDYLLDPKVQSFQVEIKLTGFRETEDDIVNTASRLAAAIGKLTEVVPIIGGEVVEAEEKLPFDPQKVNEAVEHIVDTFQTTVAMALIDVGNYLIDTFFGGNYESASNPRNVEGDASILQIQKQLRHEIASPSQSWVYDAIKVSAYSKMFEKENFQTFGNLSISQRVKIAYYSGDMEEKKQLAQLSYEKKWSVRDLSKEIKTREFNKRPIHEQLVSLLASPKEFLKACEDETFQEELQGLELAHQKEIQDKAKKEAKKIAEQIAALKLLKTEYEKLVK